jgi:hypothetical protein
MEAAGAAQEAGKNLEMTVFADERLPRSGVQEEDDCPPLFRYFSDAPASLYAQVKARA